MEAYLGICEERLCWDVVMRLYLNSVMRGSDRTGKLVYLPHTLLSLVIMCTVLFNRTPIFLKSCIKIVWSFTINNTGHCTNNIISQYIVLEYKYVHDIRECRHTKLFFRIKRVTVLRLLVITINSFGLMVRIGIIILLEE